MPSSSYLISTDANKCGSVELDENGELQQMTMYPVAPNPDHLPSKSPGGISTQWLVQHPTLPLVVALTSYWNTQPAHLSCFKLNDTDNDTNHLTKLVGVESNTGGREAVYGVFSPHKQDAELITLAIAHHNDGFVSFFTFSTTEMPTSLMNQPTVTLELPELKEGTKHLLSKGAKTGLSKPSSHHILYDRLGKYLWIVDPNQSAIFTYECNPKTGLPVGESPMPSSIFHCHTDAPSLTWLGSIVGTLIMGLSCRPRRIATSPNGEFMYVLYETRNVIQVYGVNPKTGEIDTACLQEVSTLDPKLLKQAIIGLTFQASAEMKVYHNALYVSNRSDVVGNIGKGENSIRIFAIRDGGRLAIEPKSVVCNGPVRHFAVMQKDGKEILVAGTSQPAKSLQTFLRDMDRSLREDHPNDFELVGEADIDMNIFCVLPVGIEADNDEDNVVIPSITNSAGRRVSQTSIVQHLKAKQKADDKKKEEVADAISQMEELAMASSFSNRGEEDAVLVEAEPDIKHV